LVDRHLSQERQTYLSRGWLPWPIATGVLSDWVRLTFVYQRTSAPGRIELLAGRSDAIAAATS
jgi:hypothetical protein